MPDVAIEVASTTDSWPYLKRKIARYIDDGAGYAIAINPETGQIFERGDAPAGLALDVRAIVEA